MTSKEWDAHEARWCATCRYTRRCPAKRVMRNDPADQWSAALFRRLGRCSQWEQKPERKKNTRKKG